MRMDKLLIVVCGLPGTGKTESSNKLAESLPSLVCISQNEVRREFGMKRMPKTQDAVLREIDQRIAACLISGKSVVFDSVNRYLFRRQQLYGIASCLGARVITLEMTCPEEIAKKRMMNRSPADGLVSDASDPKVYDKMRIEWEDVMMDFKRPGVDHVSYIRFDSYIGEMMRIIQRNGTRKFISKMGHILDKTA
jgi:predicted kinase